MFPEVFYTRSLQAPGPEAVPLSRGGFFEAGPVSASEKFLSKEHEILLYTGRCKSLNEYEEIFKKMEVRKKYSKSIIYL